MLKEIRPVKNDWKFKGGKALATRESAGQNSFPSKVHGVWVGLFAPEDDF